MPQQGKPAAEAIPVHNDETIESILGGRRRILQKADGYRYSLDALLLTAFVSVKERERLCDLGTGSGIIPVILADRWPGAEIVGVEIQEELAAMAARSVALNGLAKRITIIRGDLSHAEALFPPLSFDAVTANPPYRKQGSGKVNPHPQRALARHELAGSAASFLKAAAYILKAAGRAYLIYPATRMVELLTQMRKHRLEPKRLHVVHTSPTSGGTFVLVVGIKGGGEGLAVMPPLFLYGDDGAPTEAMRRLMENLSGRPGVDGE